MIPKIYANMRPNGCIVHLSDNVVLQKDIADYWPVLFELQLHVHAKITIIQNIEYALSLSVYF